MTLLSAFDDFLTTLASVPGQFSKLRYMSRLRNTVRAYQHWGMTRIHGEREAQAAIEQAHQQIFVRLLQTPLRQIVEQVRLTRDFAYLRDSEKDWESLLPNDLGGGSRRHFIALLRTVAALVPPPSPSAPSSA
jgi:hypothetical protein